MKPEIIDLVDSTKTKKPIELVHCLQIETNLDGVYYFCKSFYSEHLRHANKITRLTTFKSNECVFDVIETETNVATNIFLGHWNDGVIE